MRGELCFDAGLEGIAGATARGPQLVRKEPELETGPATLGGGK